MKISKGEGVIVLLASLFVTFTAGWFLRGALPARPIRVETQRTLTAGAAEVTASTPTPAPIDLNTATAEELQTLPGIGEKRAADIIADREKNGPYRFPEELTRVRGIGEETAAELAEYVTVGGGGA